MNLWDLAILLAVAAVVLFSFVRARRRKAEGKCSCGCCASGDCGSCHAAVSGAGIPSSPPDRASERKPGPSE